MVSPWWIKGNVFLPPLADAPVVRFLLESFPWWFLFLISVAIHVVHVFCCTDRQLVLTLTTLANAAPMVKLLRIPWAPGALVFRVLVGAGFSALPFTLLSSACAATFPSFSRHSVVARLLTSSCSVARNRSQSFVPGVMRYPFATCIGWFSRQLWLRGCCYLIGSFDGLLWRLWRREHLLLTSSSRGREYLRSYNGSLELRRFRLLQPVFHRVCFR